MSHASRKAIEFISLSQSCTVVLETVWPQCQNNMPGFLSFLVLGFRCFQIFDELGGSCALG